MDARQEAEEVLRVERLVLVDPESGADEASGIPVGSRDLADIYGTMSAERRLETDAFVFDEFTLDRAADTLATAPGTGSGRCGYYELSEISRGA